MCGAVLCVAAIALGIDVGWQPLPEGGLEYIIQIEPNMLQRLKDGVEITSDVDPSLRGIRSYRIVVGNKELPRRALPEPAGESLTLPEDSPPLNKEHASTDPWRLPADPNRDRLDWPRRDRFGSPPAAKPVSSSQSPSDAGQVSRPPRLLDPANTTRPIEGSSTAFLQPPTAAEPKPSTPAVANVQPATEKIPPLTWTVTIGALIAAVGGMLYLGWIAWDYRARYRALLERMMEGGRLPRSEVDPLNPGTF
jgi:hypothetical protein